MIQGVPIYIGIHAWNTELQDHQAGDAANITLRISKDGGTPQAPSGTLEEYGPSMPGLYKLQLSANETNANSVIIHGVSSTPNVKLYPITAPSDQGLITPIKDKTDKLNFNGDDDLKVTLDSEQVTITVASRDDLINTLLAKPIPIANGLSLSQVITAALTSGTHSVASSNPGTGTIVVQDLLGSQLVVFDYSTDAEGNIVSRIVSS